MMPPSRSSIFGIVATLGVLVWLPSSACAQVAPLTPVPMFGLSAGFGNAYGWRGGALEVYGVKGRASVRVGAGQLPGPAAGIPGSIAYAGALRWHVRTGRHGLALDATYSMLWYSTISQGSMLLSRRHSYGPGVGAAYRLAGSNGLHFDFGVGAGWSIRRSEVRTTVGIGLGYTWRLR